MIFYSILMLLSTISCDSLDTNQLSTQYKQFRKSFAAEVWLKCYSDQLKYDNTLSFKANDTYLKFPFDPYYRVEPDSILFVQLFSICLLALSALVMLSKEPLYTYPNNIMLTLIILEMAIINFRLVDYNICRMPNVAYVFGISIGVPSQEVKSFKFD